MENTLKLQINVATKEENSINLGGLTLFDHEFTYTWKIFIYIFLNAS